MPPILKCLVALQAMGLVACATLPASETAEQEMMAADRAFAARAMEIGPGAAFVEFAAEDVTIFPAGGVPQAGKAAATAWTGSWPSDLVIGWAPEAAHASKAGDFGYTWGYATFSRQGEAGETYGKYITVWKRQTDGSWKWIADMGSAAPPPESR
jgi:ketosteroid isomerase-like protein